MDFTLIFWCSLLTVIPVTWSDPFNGKSLEQGLPVKEMKSLAGSALLLAGGGGFAAAALPPEGTALPSQYTGKSALLDKIQFNAVTPANTDRPENNVNTTPPDTHCCENGGICFLGSFCHCPRTYYGRRCEHRQRSRSCGPVRHGGAYTDGCNFCQCHDGILTCFPNILGCEKQENAIPGRAKVFDLRKLKRRKRRRHKHHKSTTPHPLLNKVLRSGGKSLTVTHWTFTVVLVTILLWNILLSFH